MIGTNKKEESSGALFFWRKHLFEPVSDYWLDEDKSPLLEGL